ncbi:MAG: GNAT family N-acetyltransferase [Phycisphaeraceae bacterium]|nr:GNAT family N-acetyltransferase [Phycisphaeraceae bacterium]
MEPRPRLSFSIRNGTAGDAPSIAELIGELGFQIGLPQLSAKLADSCFANACLVAESQSKVAGVATTHITPVLHRSKPVGRVTMLVVSETMRGHGIGRSLVEEAERRLSGAGCGLIEITCNDSLEDAHSFYEHLGYRRTSVRFFKPIDNSGQSSTRK